jgi:hypothetical protein
MSPAFSSTRQAAAFGLLILVLLLLPAFLKKTELPSREQMYSAIPWRMGAFPYIHKVIFEEKGDIDIAFIGDSHMYDGVDTPYVADALTKALGRKANVVTVAWLLPGVDALYFVARDLLQNRKVHTIVFVDITEDSNKSPHPAAPYWFRFGDDARALDGLPIAVIPQYYFAAILGMPRNLLSLIRPNSPDCLFSQESIEFFHTPHPYYHLDNPADRLGSLPVDLSFNFADFVDYVPVPGASPSEVSIYSKATADQFQFSKQPMFPLQLHFSREFAALAKARGTGLVLLTIPTIKQQTDSFIQQSAYWSSEILNSDLTMVGIPPAKLFSGIAPDNIAQLFTPDGIHLNKNGQEYFTRLITPTLLKIYETQAKH